MRASEIAIPGLGSHGYRWPNQRTSQRVVAGVEQDVIHMPVLLIIFNDDGKSRAGLLAEAQRRANVLARTTFPNISSFWDENSYGRFNFDFRLRTAIIDAPMSSTGGLPDVRYRNEPPYDPLNLDDYVPVERYTGYENLVVWKKDPNRNPEPEYTEYFHDYLGMGQRNRAVHALADARASTYPWDAEMEFDEWLDFGVARGDSRASISMISPSFASGTVTGFGFRPDDGITQVQQSAKDRGVETTDSVSMPVEIEGRTLREVVLSNWNWHTFAHELGHVRGGPDLYNPTSSSGLLVRKAVGGSGITGKSISLFGYATGAPHVDGVTKFLFDWLDPQIIELGSRRRVRLAPVYEDSTNALLVRPDGRSHGSECFLIEVRGKGDRNWRGEDLVGDRQLHDELRGVCVYHANGAPMGAERPRIDLEGEPRGAVDIVALQAGQGLTATQTFFYDGVPSGLTIDVVEEHDDGSYTLDIGRGKDVGELYAVGAGGEVSKLAGYPDWSHEWTHIVPGNFADGHQTDLVFYDQRKSEGNGLFYTLGRDLQPQLVRRNNWHPGWTHIVPGRFGGSDSTDLLFYNQSSGASAFFATDGAGNLSKLDDAEWFTGWTHIVPGRFGLAHGVAPHLATDLTFYNAASGDAAIFTTDGRGNLSKLKDHDWYTGWTHIVPGNFGPGLNTDLLFYNASNGDAAFFTTDAEGNLSKLRDHDWYSDWTHIVPGNFGATPHTDLLFYNRANGEAVMFTTDGAGNLLKLLDFERWRTTWSLIVPGNFAPGATTQLLFYDNTIRTD